MKEMLPIKTTYVLFKRLKKQFYKCIFCTPVFLVFLFTFSLMRVLQYKKVKSKRNGATAQNCSLFPERKQRHGGRRGLGSFVFSSFFTLQLFIRRGHIIHKMNHSHTAIFQLLLVRRKAVCFQLIFAILLKYRDWVAKPTIPQYQVLHLDHRLKHVLISTSLDNSLNPSSDPGKCTHFTVLLLFSV